MKIKPCHIPLIEMLSPYADKELKFGCLMRKDGLIDIYIGEKEPEGKDNDIYIYNPKQKWCGHCFNSEEYIREKYEILGTIDQSCVLKCAENGILQMREPIDIKLGHEDGEYFVIQCQSGEVMGYISNTPPLEWNEEQVNDFISKFGEGKQSNTTT